MIPEFIKRYTESKDNLALKISIAPPDNYLDLVKLVIGAITSKDEYFGKPDPARIHQIDDGDYQGTLVFVIGAEGCQPSDYWYLKLMYGSCSGCDTLKKVRDNGTEPVTSQQVEDYMTLALHIVQGIKKMED